MYPASTSQKQSASEVAPMLAVVFPSPHLSHLKEDAFPTWKKPTSHVQSAKEIDPVLGVVKPLPQLAQDEPSKKYPTSQMHSEAEVAPGAAVVLGIYLLSTLGSQ